MPGLEKISFWSIPMFIYLWTIIHVIQGLLSKSPNQKDDLQFPTILKLIVAQYHQMLKVSQWR